MLQARLHVALSNNTKVSRDEANCPTDVYTYEHSYHRSQLLLAPLLGPCQNAKTGQVRNRKKNEQIKTPFDQK